VRALANHGRSAHYEHAVVGWNSRMDAIQAAWLLRALKVIDTVIEERRRLVREYANQLRPPYNTYVVPPMTCDDNGYLQVSMVSDAAGAVRRLVARGVEARRIYPLTLADQPGGKATAIPVGELPISRSVAERVLSLPLWYRMTDKDVERCADALREVGGAR
jgi:dTDP-4-amino-4,6-dideoxygalactose transaminase